MTIWVNQIVHAGLYMDESEMALFCACMLTCARKLLDTADIIREAMLSQLTTVYRMAVPITSDFPTTRKLARPSPRPKLIEDYASTMGRFMTPDWAARATAVPYAVFGDPQSLNLYGYVRNDPVSRADRRTFAFWQIASIGEVFDVGLPG